MTSKKGRPTSEPKGHRESFRLSDKDIEKLQFCISKTGMTKTGVIRAGIQLVYEQVTKK